MSCHARHAAHLAVLLVSATLPISSCGTSPAETGVVSTTAASTSPTTTRQDPPPRTDSVEITPTLAASDTGAPASTCRRLTDFDDDNGWFIVNDGVMGGRSTGIINIGDSVMQFSGSVVTDGGGFTSVRVRLDGEELTDSAHIAMRVRSDDRTYQVTLEDDASVGQRTVSHQADLDTTGSVDGDGWTVATFDYSELEPSVFGRSVTAPPFNPGAAREIGVIIADGVDGDFSLDIDWIDVCD